jgi:pyruvate,water dikinase
LPIGSPQTGVILQQLVDADVAGVLFTRNPMTGADEIVIEASWGLGEAVVASRVTPDRFRLDRAGRRLERILGDKEVRFAVRGEHLEECETTRAERGCSCLSDTQLRALHSLVRRIETVWAGPHDVEFAFRGNDLFLLQRRPLTTG